MTVCSVQLYIGWWLVEKMVVCKCKVRSHLHLEEVRSHMDWIVRMRRVVVKMEVVKALKIVMMAVMVMRLRSRMMMEMRLTLK